jgi:hypothetical protein
MSFGPSQTGQIVHLADGRQVVKVSLPRFAAALVQNMVEGSVIELSWSFSGTEAMIRLIRAR